jgi:hypothetical protein
MTSLIWLIIGLALLAAVSFWAGFRSNAHPLQYQSKAGFVIMVALIVFTSYFAIREINAVNDLAKIIEPVPGITREIYLPTASTENVISSGPSPTTSKTQKNEEKKIGGSHGQKRERNWLVYTSLPPTSVISHYREISNSSDWLLVSDSAPWLIFSRGKDQLKLYVSHNSREGGSKVLYTFTSFSH